MKQIAILIGWDGTMFEQYRDMRDKLLAILRDVESNGI